jgi:ABC transporter substrate binding protein (PQQ-dependent alcohol dehydrogenase system)
MIDWRWAAVALLLIPTTAVQAATLTIGVVQRTDDDRLDAKRVELAYPHQPGGTLTQAAEVAVKESAFELDAAKLQVKLDVRSARSADEAKAALQQLSKAGAAAVVLDIPAAWMSAANAVTMPLFNAGDPDEGPRQQGCAANLFHTLPSDRMRADALAQTLLARKWSRVLVLQGPRSEDAAQLALVQAAIKRYGLKTVAVRPFKLSADPRERDLGNPLLLTGNADFDVVWVIDADYEFARSLPYKTSLPRPVVGDAGLLAEAWATRFERFGAPQLNRRFARAANRPMTGPDWAAYIATKAVLQAAMEQAANPSSAQILKALTRADFTLDGFKGVRLSFRAWDRQLRQPLLMTDGVGVIGTAPVEGVMHPKNVLDTLGADAPESSCKSR